MTKWIIGAMLLGAVQAGAVDFYAHWADGKAEISSYEVVQPRYGELRQGYGVMIFVTESLHRQTFIKVDSPTPEADQFYALKLNHILQFTTGIYDYSVMTSVFSQVAGERHPFELRRISFSAQEWCGQVFDEALFRDGQINGRISSYFASEGRGLSAKAARALCERGSSADPHPGATRAVYGFGRGARLGGAAELLAASAGASASCDRGWTDSQGRRGAS